MIILELSVSWGGVESLRIQDIPKQMFPGLKDEETNRLSETLPKMSFASKLFSTGFIKVISEFKDLVKQECQQVEDQEVEGKVFGAMTIP